ncbi:VapE domain-containing protein, partial [Paenibacillus larvae]
ITDFPRKCVFFGSTNNWDFLKDPTGNRRFWPVSVKPERRTKNVFEDLTEYEIGQIWAEALQAYHRGERITLSPEVEKEAPGIQESHMEEDPRFGIIQEWLDSPVQDEWAEEPTYRERVCASQILTECLGHRKGLARPWESKEIVNIMRRMPGWEEAKGRIRIPGYGQQTGFVKCKK